MQRAMKRQKRTRWELTRARTASCHLLYSFGGTWDPERATYPPTRDNRPASDLSRSISRTRKWKKSVYGIDQARVPEFGRCSMR